MYSSTGDANIDYKIREAGGEPLNMYDRADLEKQSQDAVNYVRMKNPLGNYDAGLGFADGAEAREHPLYK